MTFGVGESMLIAAAISAAASVYSGQVTASATRNSARIAANNQRNAAYAKSKAMRANAQRQMLDVEYSRKRERVEKREMSKTHEIQAAANVNAAAASGFTVAGTSLERVLSQQAGEDERTQETLGWEWTNKINRQLDSVSMTMYEAEMTEITGQNMATSTYASGSATANAQATSGWVKGFGTLGSGAAKAVPEWGN